MSKAHREEAAVLEGRPVEYDEVVNSPSYQAIIKYHPEVDVLSQSLKKVIKEIHEKSRGTHGSPRIHAELKMGRGIRCSRKRVFRRMRELRIQGASRRGRYGCTRRDPKKEVYPDLVDKRFVAEVPNRLWVADITQHPTAQGFLYIAVLIDVFSRMVIGWSMSARQSADLVVAALNMAVRNRRPAAGVTHHSDHGSQYTSIQFGKRLRDAGVLGSMGSVGDALDNAVVESFFSSLQVELLNTRAWATRDQLRTAAFEYIEVFYNRQRRHSSLGDLAPWEFELKSQQDRLAAGA
jgi:putative transposase